MKTKKSKKQAAVKKKNVRQRSASRAPVQVKKRPAPRRSVSHRTAGPSSERLESILQEVTGEGEEKKQSLEHWGHIQCPYCGESFEVHVEAAEDGQTVYEDCHVCCKPISVFIHVEEGVVQLSAYRA